MGEIRRGFSVTVVRGAAMCLLERLAHLAPGARAAAERRQLTLRLEERRRHESEAYYMAHMGLEQKCIATKCLKINGPI